MMFCPEHHQKIVESVKAWGLCHLAPFSAQEKNRRGRARLLGSNKVGDFDPVDYLVHNLETLLTERHAYDDDEDDEECAVCAYVADHLIDFALNTTLARFHKLHGPAN